MSLQAGHKLAHYEIVEPIGKGGMGEVYLANDSKLGRDVAIKVLPDEFAQDAERLRRFQREAKVLASLNHPNIASIYGLEQSGETHYLVLELVPGETLAERIVRGPIPVDEALGIATKIAEALEEAHEHGIVHRDLKPANIKLTPDDKIKVLDFGLAKAFAEEGPDSDAATSMSPTITRDATRIGVILGTAAYMSPEQAKGKPVDKRADIWAFGAVLYEMLTGKRAFEGDDVSDTLAYVLTKSPDWSALPAETTVAVSQMLQLCLTKDVKQRVRDVGDVRLGMGGAFQVPITPTSTMRPGPRWWAAALLASTVVAGIAVWSGNRPGPSTVTVSRFTIAPPAPVRVADRSGFDVIVSPDGNDVAFIGEHEGERMLYVRAVDELEARPIAGSESVDDPFFSPDGEWIGFEAPSQGKLMRVSLAGGPALTIVDDPGTRGAAWGESNHVIVAKSSGLWRVAVAGGGELERLTAESNEVDAYSEPQFLPGADAVLFAYQSGPGMEDEHIGLLDLNTGEQTIVLERGSNPYYAHSGHLVFVRGNTLMAAPFDVEKRELTGEPAVVIEGIRHPPSVAADYAVSTTGTLVYIPFGSGPTVRTLVWVDRHGEEQEVGVEPGIFELPRLSPDGDRVAVDIEDASGRSDIWTLDLTRSALTRLTFENNNSSPQWTPDGTRISYSASVAGQVRLMSRSADASQAQEELATSPMRFLSIGGWSPDGRSLVLTGFSSDTVSWDIQVMEPGETPRAILATRFHESQPSISPDGRWLAYTSDESGRREIYVTTFPEPAARMQASTEGGTDPAWSSDGGKVFFYRPGGIWSADVSTEPELRVGKPDLRFETNIEVDYRARGRGYDVSPDNQRLLMLKKPEQSLETRIVVVQNWFEELKRLVPTN